MRTPGTDAMERVEQLTRDLRRLRDALEFSKALPLEMSTEAFRDRILERVREILGDQKDYSPSVQAALDELKKIVGAGE